MNYLRQLICGWKLIFCFCIICFDCSTTDANLLSRKFDRDSNKDSDVIIITDFKGDSLTQLLNQLKSNSSTRPISERIEKTIKQSNLKGNPFTNHSPNVQASRFGAFNSFFDRARLGGNKLNDKLNGGSDRLSHKLLGDKYHSDDKIVDQVYRPAYSIGGAYSMLNGLNNNNKLNFNQLSNQYMTNSGYFTSNPQNSQNSLTNRNAGLTYPIAYQFTANNNQAKDQNYITYASPTINKYPILNYDPNNKLIAYDYNQPAKHYLPYTFKPTFAQPTVAPSSVSTIPMNYDSLSNNNKPTFYEPTQPTNFDQNKYLPNNYEQNYLSSNYYLNTSAQMNSSPSSSNQAGDQQTHRNSRIPTISSHYTQPSRSINPHSNSLSSNAALSNLLSNTLTSSLSDASPNQYNSSDDLESEIDYESLPSMLTLQSNTTTDDVDDLIRRNMFDSYRMRYPSKFRQMHRFPPSIPFNYRLNPHSHFRTRPHLLNGQQLERFNNNFEVNNPNENQSKSISNELVNSLINKLSEKKLLNINQLQSSQSQSTEDKTIKSILATNQLLNASFDQDDLLKNTQLLSKFEQINNKILTNLLLTTYLNNLTKQPKINASLKNSYSDSFEDDSQADRLAESSIKYKKVRRRSQQPSQIIIKKYIQVPANTGVRKRIKKIQRKNTNIKSPIRPLIIKKIETPSIVIESSPSAKLKKNFAMRKLSNFMDDSLEDDSLNGLALNGYVSENSLNGLVNFGGEDTYDFGSKLDSLNSLGVLNNYESNNNYRLNNMGGSNAFRSTLFNTYPPVQPPPPSPPPQSYASSRNFYLRKHKFDDLPIDDPSIDDNQINDIRSRRPMSSTTINEYYAIRRPFHYNHLPAASTINDQNSTYYSVDPKRTKIEERPFFRDRDNREFVKMRSSITRPPDRFDERLNGDRLLMIDRFREDEKFKDDEKIRVDERIRMNERIRDEERFKLNDTPIDWPRLKADEKFNRFNGEHKFEKSRDEEKEMASNFEKSTENRLMNHRLNDGTKLTNAEKTEEATRTENEKYNLDKFNVLEKLKNELDELNATNNSSKLVYDMPENNFKSMKQVPKLIIIDETN